MREVEEGYSYTDTAEDPEESEEERDMKSDLIAGVQREPKEFLTHIDGKEIEKRPVPKPAHSAVMKTRFYCATCLCITKVLDYDEESGIIKLDCAVGPHFRNVSVKVVGV